MASTFSQNLRLELIASGSQTGVWGNTTNNNLGDLIEQAVSGATDLNVTSGDITLTALNGVVDQARSAVLSIVGSAGVTRTVTIPNVSKAYTVKNRSDATINLKTASGSEFEIPTLSEAYVYCNGDDVITGRVITDGANAVNSLPDPFNNAALTGVPTAPTASLGTDTTQVATTAFVQDATAVAIPSGVIMMWSGSIGSIPAGFLLCNGASGTPDLRDRFVVGAGSSYSPGNTGGANTVTLTTAQLPSHTHTGSTSTVNLAHAHTFSATTNSVNLSHNHSGSGTTANVNINHTHSGTTGNNSVGHNHGFSGNTGNNNVNHSHAVNDPGHSHGGIYTPSFFTASGGGPTTPVGTSFGNTDIAFTGISLGANNANHIHAFSGTTANNSANHNHAFTTGTMSANAVHAHSFSFTTASELGNHNHTVSGTTGAMSANVTHAHTFTTNATGSGAAHENRPPYFALAYIMKT